LTGAANFLPSSSSFILTRAEWTPFQNHCYSDIFGIAANRTRDLWVYSNELSPLHQLFRKCVPYLNVIFHTTGGIEILCTVNDSIFEPQRFGDRV
jgi:hypothetical protein